jgi:hypothetical protein
MPITVDVDPLFVAILEQMRQDAADISISADASERRPWQLPPSFSGEVTDEIALEAFYDRMILNASYEDELSKPASADDNRSRLGALMSASYQIDQVAAHGRAVALRHAGPIRCAALAAKRRNDHGENLGSVTRPIDYAYRLLSAAYDQAGDPTVDTSGYSQYLI